MIKFLLILYPRDHETNKWRNEIVAFYDTLIKTNANLIITNNIKDFPEEYLQSFSLNAQTADDFLTDLIDLNQEQAVAAFKEMVLNKKKSKQDEFEVLNLLRNAGLKDTANYLHSLI